MFRAYRRMGLAALGVAPAAVLVVAVAHAQAHDPTTSDPLAPARTLFGEALHDEEAGRFTSALEKFEQVRAVRDTASIEFRIGSCYEGLGKPAPAFGAYRAAVALGREDGKSVDVSQAASDRLEALGKLIAQLTLVMPSPPPAAVEVRIDDEVAAPVASEPIPLAPGHHVVSATAFNAVPFRSEIALAAGAQVVLTVVLEPPPSEPEPARRKASAPATAGWLAIGAGAALLTSSAILLVARHDDIAALDRSCPGGICPPGVDANDLESRRSRALVEGPVAVACGVVGIGAALAGLYLVLAAHRPDVGGFAFPVVPVLAREAGGLAFTSTFR
jgi:hypothetical protein